MRGSTKPNTARREVSNMPNLAEFIASVIADVAAQVLGDAIARAGARAFAAKEKRPHRCKAHKPKHLRKR